MKITHEQLAKNLSNGLADCYWIYGDEIVLLNQTTDRVIEEAIKSHYQITPAWVVDAAFDWLALQDQLYHYALFAEKTLYKLYFYQNKFPEESKQFFQRLAERPLTEKLLLIRSPKLDKAILQSRWFNQLAARITVINIKPIYANQFADWLRQRCAAMGYSLVPDAMQLLLQSTEGNSLAAEQALTRLQLLYPATTKITQEMLAPAVEMSAQHTVYQLAQTAMIGDTHKALHIFERIYSSTEASLILWAICKEIRLCYALLFAQSQQKNIDTVFKQHGIWEQQQWLYKTAIKHYTLPQLGKLLQLAQQIDESIKTGKGADLYHAFTRLLILMSYKNHS